MRRRFYFGGFFGSLMLLSMAVWGGLQAEEKESHSKPSVLQAKNFEGLLGKVLGLHEDLLKMHFKLYQGYVENANAVQSKLKELEEQGHAKTPEFAALKRILGWEYDGVLLHEYYFENLVKSKELNAADPLYAAMQKSFGSYEGWLADFKATGSMRGIGWVVTYLEPRTGSLINAWINEHDVGHLAGAKPLLVMDVFEHAYITQFGLDRAKYIEVFLSNINWEVVSRRFKT